MSFISFPKKYFEMENKFLLYMMNLFQGIVPRVGSKYLVLER